MGFTRLYESYVSTQFHLCSSLRIITRNDQLECTFRWPFASFSMHTNESASLLRSPGPSMPDLKTIVSKADHPLRKADRVFLAKPRPRAPDDPRQRGLMVGSLCLLLLALSIVLWRDRDFWFPETPEAESTQPVESSPVAQVAPSQPSATIARHAKGAKQKHPIAKTRVAPEANNPVPRDPSPPGATIGARTVLPPLEVEVVAGDSHRTVRPGSNSVRVELQPDTPPQSTTDGRIAGDSETAANVTSEAAERVQMSTTTSENVTSPVRPNYPLLARQMKVQGSVILQALIGKDGVIQNLRVVSGPHILASAAQDAVRQWHFKPHYQGSEAVETQAKITVNFTISTN
jgi:TonB family protein